MDAARTPPESGLARTDSYDTLGAIINAGLTASVEDLLEFPASSASPPFARINLLLGAPDAGGRVFANDLNGPFYVIEGTVVSVYADPDFAELCARDSDPHRASLDPDRVDRRESGNGTAFVSDIGQGNGEEVNLLVAGANYGWPNREGVYALDPLVDPEVVFALPPNDASFGYSYPVAWTDHEEGQAIAGGIVYRGAVVSPLRGRFVFGDVVSGRMFYRDVSEIEAVDDGDPATTATVYELNLLSGGQPTTLRQIVANQLGIPNDNRTDLRFAALSSGEMYITTKRDGFLRRLTRHRAHTYRASPRQASRYSHY